MNKKAYFYKDKDGKIQKYIYCSRCPTGPFVQEQLHIDVIKIGNDNSSQPTYLCKTCGFFLGYNSKFNRIERKIPEYEPEELKPSKTKRKAVESIEEEPKEVIQKPIIQPPAKLVAPQNVNGEEWVVFAVKCKDGTICYSSTQNLEKAIMYMNTSKGPKITRPKERRPVTFLYKKVVSSKEEARKMRIDLEQRKVIVISSP